MDKHIRDIVKRVNSRLTMRSLRGVAVLVIAIAAMTFWVTRIANADLAKLPVDKVKSPIPGPITVVVNCDETWNPNCRSTATTTAGVVIRSYFYIDGRLRGYERSTGSVEGTYNNVCRTYRLRDGSHTARVVGRDQYGNTAGVGPYRVIKCDRTGPYVTTGLKVRRGVVSIAPYAVDRVSGVDTATEELLIDGNAETWGSSADVCTNFGLDYGLHWVLARASDNAGNRNASYRAFYCR